MENNKQQLTTKTGERIRYFRNIKNFQNKSILLILIYNEL